MPAPKIYARINRPSEVVSAATPVSSVDSPVSNVPTNGMSGIGDSEMISTSERREISSCAAAGGGASVSNFRCPRRGFREEEKPQFHVFSIRLSVPDGIEQLPVEEGDFHHVIVFPGRIEVPQNRLVGAMQG